MIDTAIFGLTGYPHALYNSQNLNAVDCYIPEWTSEVMPARLKSYHSVMDQRRSDLVHQTASAENGLLYTANAWVSVPSIFRRADGKFTRINFALTESEFQFISELRFGTLAEATGNRFATLDANAAAPAPVLGPTASSITTVGHSLNLNFTKPILGRRYRTYTDTQELQSEVGGIAIDAASTFVFYTQAPDPQEKSFQAYNPRDIYFETADSAPSTSVQANAAGQVWIVVIF